MELLKQQLNNIVYTKEGVKLADGTNSNYVEIIFSKEKIEDYDVNKNRIAFKMNCENRKIQIGQNKVINYNDKVRKKFNDRKKALRRRRKKIYVPNAKDLKKHLKRNMTAQKKWIKHIIQSTFKNNCLSY